MTKTFKKLYDWMISWADSPNSVTALFLIAFAESSFFPIPPDPLLIIMALGKPKRAIYFGFMCALASVMGGLLGYLIGAFAYDLFGRAIIEFYHQEELYMKFVEVFSGEWGFLWIFTAGFARLFGQLVKENPLDVELNVYDQAADSNTVGSLTSICKALSACSTIVRRKFLSSFGGKSTLPTGLTILLPGTIRLDPTIKATGTIEHI